jgi:hypothetical protein
MPETILLAPSCGTQNRLLIVPTCPVEEEGMEWEWYGPQLRTNGLTLWSKPSIKMQAKFSWEYLTGNISLMGLILSVDSRLA